MKITTSIYWRKVVLPVIFSNVLFYTIWSIWALKKHLDFNVLLLGVLFFYCAINTMGGYFANQEHVNELRKLKFAEIWKEAEE